MAAVLSLWRSLTLHIFNFAQTFKRLNLALQRADSRMSCCGCVSPSLGDLAVLVLVHDEVCGLTRRVDDERVAVEPLQHDGVLDTQVVRG